MPRRVFFSFHYQRDIWRVNVVRNCWVTQDRESAGFWDASLWESAKKKGDAAIQKMIDDGLANTSVSVVLIGTETWERKWVRYEIIQSYQRGNGLFGVYIHSIKNQLGYSDVQGNNPFDHIYIEENGFKKYFSSIYPTYDWYWNDGYENFGSWVESAAKAAGR